jgi:hypothetical protein
VVWSTIVNQMYEDGGFQQVYQTWIDQRTDVTCAQVQKEGASIALRVADLAGTPQLSSLPSLSSLTSLPTPTALIF